MVGLSDPQIETGEETRHHHQDNDEDGFMLVLQATPHQCKARLAILCDSTLEKGWF